MAKLKHLGSYIYKKAEGVNGILLIGYLFIAIFQAVYEIVDTYIPVNAGIGIFLIACVGIGCCFLCPWLIRKIRGFYLMKDGVNAGKERIFIWGLIFGVISFGILFIWYIGYYPGFFYSDLKDQLDQAISGHYNDWHPVLQTLLVFTLPLKLTGGWKGSIILFQMLFFSLITGYMGTVIVKYSNWKLALAAVLFIVLNPITGKICLYPLKDITFAVWALLLMIFAAQIYFSDGKWLDHILHAILLSVALVVATLVRHNGILFTIPLLAGSILYTNKKRGFQILFLTILLLVSIKGPIYSYLNVESPGERQVEILGLPMTVLGNVVKKQPERLDQETRDFLYAVAPKEDWETYYTRGRFNSIKWGPHTDLSMIEKTGTMQILKMTFQCMLRAPIASCEAVVALTKMVYTLDESSCFYQMGIDLDRYEVPYAGNYRVLSNLESYCEMIYGNVVLKYVFCYIGMMNLLMIIFVLGKTQWKMRNDLKRMLLCIPVLTYNFGTMLLLSGRDDRFFYVSFVAFPMAGLIMLGKKQY